MNHLSLFSGIGGIDLAAEWAGFHSVAMVEKDNYCQQVLRKNFPEAELYGDILEFDGTKYENRIDLISAGFPCQPFSLAGSRKGADDERALWPEVVRVLRDVKPTWFLGENVPGLLTSGQYRGEYFNYICNSLSEMGYRVGWCLYGAKDVGAVHRRNRVFIVAHSNSVRRSQYSHSEWTQLGPGRTAQCRVEGYDSCICGPSSTNSEGEPSDGGGLGEQLCPKSQAQEFRGGNSKGYAAYSEHVRCEDIQEEGLERQDHQERKEGREDVGGRHWQPISGGNWREWDTTPILYETRAEPRVRRANDGIPNRVDRLKCLGNAVVPQQVFPILEEIARQIKCD